MESRRNGPQLSSRHDDDDDKCRHNTLKYNNKEKDKREKNAHESLLITVNYVHITILSEN